MFLCFSGTKSYMLYTIILGCFLLYLWSPFLIRFCVPMRIRIAIYCLEDNWPVRWPIETCFLFKVILPHYLILVKWRKVDSNHRSRRYEHPALITVLLLHIGLCRMSNHFYRWLAWKRQDSPRIAISHNPILLCLPSRIVEKGVVI